MTTDIINKSSRSLNEAEKDGKLTGIEAGTDTKSNRKSKKQMITSIFCEKKVYYEVEVRRRKKRGCNRKA